MRLLYANTRFCPRPWFAVLIADLHWIALVSGQFTISHLMMSFLLSCRISIFLDVPHWNMLPFLNYLLYNCSAQGPLSQSKSPLSGTNTEQKDEHIPDNSEAKCKRRYYRPMQEFSFGIWRSSETVLVMTLATCFCDRVQVFNNINGKDKTTR